MSSLKPIVKSVLRAFLRSLLRPLFRRLDEVRHRLNDVNDLAVRLDRHLPLIENAITSQNADLRSSARERVQIRAEVDHLRDDLVRTRQQVESLRDDFAGAFSTWTLTQVEPAPSDIASHWPVDPPGECRLDFSWGPQNVADHVTVDLRLLERGDLAAGLRRLPFADRTAVEIRAALVMEHFSVAELRGVVLPYWYSLLRPGGTLVVVSIDAEANLSDYHAGRIDLEELASLSLGAREASAMPRCSMLSRDVVQRLLENAGFESIETVGRWRGDDFGNQIEVRARRGGGHGSQTVEAGSRSDIHA